MQTDFYVDVLPVDYHAWTTLANFKSKEEALVYIDKRKTELVSILLANGSLQLGPARYRIRIVSTEIVEV